MSQNEDDLAEEYTNAALALLWRGAAWPVDQVDSVIARFYRGLTRELARWHRRVGDLIRESDPGAAFELLDGWERSVGLPDACAPRDATVAERQAAVVARLGARGGQSIAYFEALAAQLGYEVTIAERRPFTCGVSACGEGHEVGAATIRFNWKVRVHGPRVAHFRAGEGACGIHALTMIRRAEDLECAIRRAAPGHSVLTFVYEGG